MIQLAVIGNLTKNPESVASKTGKTGAKFDMATNIGRGEYKKTIYVSVTLWGKLGDIAVKYLAKGRKVYVSGEPSFGAYNSAKDNRPVPVVYLTAAELEIIGDRKSAENYEDDSEDDKHPDSLQSQGFHDVSGEDLPF